MQCYNDYNNTTNNMISQEAIAANIVLLCMNIGYAVISLLLYYHVDRHVYNMINPFSYDNIEKLYEASILSNDMDAFRRAYLLDNHSIFVIRHHFDGKQKTINNHNLLMMIIAKDRGDMLDYLLSRYDINRFILPASDAYMPNVKSTIAKHYYYQVHHNSFVHYNRYVDLTTEV